MYLCGWCLLSPKDFMFQPFQIFWQVMTVEDNRVAVKIGIVSFGVYRPATKKEVGWAQLILKFGFLSHKNSNSRDRVHVDAFRISRLVRIDRFLSFILSLLTQDNIRGFHVKSDIDFSVSNIYSEILQHEKGHSNFALQWSYFAVWLSRTSRQWNNHSTPGGK